MTTAFGFNAADLTAAPDLNFEAQWNVTEGTINSGCTNGDTSCQVFTADPGNIRVTVTFVSTLPEDTLFVTIGGGQGQVTEANTTPAINCSDPAPGTGTCEGTMTTAFGFNAADLTAAPDLNFEAQWNVTEGTINSGCTNGDTSCQVFTADPGNIRVTVTFVSTLPEDTLFVTIGGGQGQVTEANTTPAINCSDPAPGTGTCEGTMTTAFGFNAADLTAAPDLNFEAQWNVTEGTINSGCTNGDTSCQVFTADPGNIRVTVTFVSTLPEDTLFVTIGGGQGQVTEANTTPAINCSDPAPGTGTCEGTMTTAFGFNAADLTAAPDLNFEAQWNVTEGTINSGCTNGDTSCQVFTADPGNIRVTVTFVSTLPEDTLFVTIGGGQGQVTEANTTPAINCSDPAPGTGTCEGTMTTAFGFNAADLTAAPDLNFEAQWNVTEGTINSGCTNGDTSCQVFTADPGNIRVTVTFVSTLPEDTLFVTIGGGQGQVTEANTTPAINCSDPAPGTGTCEGTMTTAFGFNAADLTAAPDLNFEAQWNVTEGTINSGCTNGDTSCQVFTADPGNIRVTVTFVSTLPEDTLFVTIGGGQGQVTEANTTPAINCSDPAPGTGTCEGTMTTAFGFNAADLTAAPDLNFEAQWNVTEGTINSGCTNGDTSCQVFTADPGNIRVTVTFVSTLPEDTLFVTIGGGQGQVTEANTTPAINCSDPAPGTGTCEGTMTTAFGFNAADLTAAPDLNFEAQWNVTEGTINSGCTNGDTSCQVFTADPGNIRVTVTFVSTLPEDTLFVTIGGGQGQVTEANTTPAINCSDPAPGRATCEGTMTTAFGFNAADLTAAPDLNFEAQWNVTEGTINSGCTNGDTSCQVFTADPGNIRVTVTFVSTLPEDTLFVTIGGGQGQVTEANTTPGDRLF